MEVANQDSRRLYGWPQLPFCLLSYIVFLPCAKFVAEGGHENQERDQTKETTEMVYANHQAAFISERYNQFLFNK